MLKEYVEKELNILGLGTIKQPIFFNCQYGIRFEIGIGDVYNEDMTPKNEYVKNALNRAMSIYNYGMKYPSVLLWQVYPRSQKDMKRLKRFFYKRIAPISPQEEFSHNINIDNNIIQQTQLYWDLNKVKVPVYKLFREVILGDIGGLEDFVSSVYLFDIENHVMLHLYDDRGLDIIAYDKNKLIPIYKKLNTWILECNRKQIDKIFIL